MTQTTVSIANAYSMDVHRQFIHAFNNRKSSIDFWAAIALYIFTALAFWPITNWLVNSTIDQSRILHALIVLIIASALLVINENSKIEKPLYLNRYARYSLYATYGTVLLSVILKLFLNTKSNDIETATTFQTLASLITLPAYCFGFGSFILFLFGINFKRLTLTIMGTFCAFILLSILMEPMDWPLRSLAGKSTSIALDWIGKSSTLQLIRAHEGVPQLILAVANKPFNVASECNGFGVIQGHPQ